MDSRTLSVVEDTFEHPTTTNEVFIVEFDRLSAKSELGPNGEAVDGGGDVGRGDDRGGGKRLRFVRSKLSNEQSALYRHQASSERPMKDLAIGSSRSSAGDERKFVHNVGRGSTFKTRRDGKGLLVRHSDDGE